MRRRRGLHLLLERPVPGIDIGEVSPAARFGLSRRRGAIDQGEPLRQMEEIVIGGDFETEIVPAGPPIGRQLPVFSDRPAGGGPRQEDQRAEVKAVAEAPDLVVVERVFPVALPNDLRIVRIGHPRPGLRRRDQTVRGAGIETDPGRIGEKKEIPRCRTGKERVPRPAGDRAIDGDRLAAGRQASGISGVEENDLPDQGIPEELLQEPFKAGDGGFGEELR